MIIIPWINRFIPVRKKKYLVLSMIFLLGTPLQPLAQTSGKITVRKERSLYFFQVEEVRDTIPPDSEPEFYLLVPDTLKAHLTIDIENGQLIPTKNDSIVKLKYMKNLKYECMYERLQTNGWDKKKKTSWEFKTLINGPSSGDSARITIRIKDKRNNKALINNSFFYKEN